MLLAAIIISSITLAINTINLIIVLNMINKRGK